MHASDASVAAALILSGKEQHKAFDNLRKTGIFKINKETVRSGDTSSILREREPLKKSSPNDLKMCGSCKGFLVRPSFGNTGKHVVAQIHYLTHHPFLLNCSPELTTW
jgi:hypothetical protein